MRAAGSRVQMQSKRKEKIGSESLEREGKTKRICQGTKRGGKVSGQTCYMPLRRQ